MKIKPNIMREGLQTVANFLKLYPSIYADTLMFYLLVGNFSITFIDDFSRYGYMLIC